MGPGNLVAVATILALLVSSSSATIAGLLPNIDWVDITPDGGRNDRPSPDPTPRQAAPGVDWNGDGKINVYEADRDANATADVFERDLDADGVLDYQDADYWAEYYQMRIPESDYDGDRMHDNDPKDRVYGVDTVPDPDPDPDPDPEVVAQETTAAEESTQEETAREETTVSDAEESASVGEDASSTWAIVLALLLIAGVAVVLAVRWAERRPRGTP